MKLLPVLALLPIFAVSTQITYAQQAGSECVAIADDAERLGCFDAAFAVAPVELGDGAVVFQSEQMIPARPTGRDYATLAVVCTSGTLAIEFAFAGNTMSALGRDAGITTLSDLQTARSRTLPVNATNTAVVIDNTGDAVAFLDGLDGATNLTVRVTPVNSRSLSVRYRVDTLPEQVAPVRAACGV